MLTQERVKELFDYDPETGVFISIKRSGPNSKLNKRAGGFHISTGYRRIAIDGKRYPEHHIVWLLCYGALPSEIDHINGVRDDNRAINLREVCRKENTKNQKIRSTNKTGIMGVYYLKHKGKWCAQIGESYLGIYEVLLEAVSARKSAEIKYGYHRNHGKR